MGPVLLLLVLFMFIFSILGMQMFGTLEGVVEDSASYHGGHTSLSLSFTVTVTLINSLNCRMIFFFLVFVNSENKLCHK